MEFEDLKGEINYQITRDGIVFRKQYSRLAKDGKTYSRKPKKISQYLSNRGYYMVDFAAKHHLLHRLLAMQFIPNPENKPCVNHKNGIKTDNRIENLEWSTYSENNQHAYDTKLKHCYYTGKHSPISKQVSKILNGIVIEIYPSARHASITNGLSHHRIGRAARRGNTVLGFKWEFTCVAL